MTVRPKSLIWEHIAESLFRPLSARQIARVICRPKRTFTVMREALTDVKLRAPDTRWVIENQREAVAALGRLGDAIGPRSRIEELEEYARPPSDDATLLGGLFENYGSDKSTTHNYHLVYGFLLGRRRSTINKILEIGLGTNNLDVLSNMGRFGRPGASLRAFRDWLPHAVVHGADIDRRILFREDRIETHYVDQTDRRSLEQLAPILQPHTFDVVIDDGLHNPVANLNTVLFGLELIHGSGLVIVEDIPERDAPYWQVAARLLDRRYRCNLVRTKIACMFIVSPKNAALAPTEAGG